MINLTPHDVMLSDGTVIPASGRVARVDVLERRLCEHGPDAQTYGVPVVERTYYGAVDLPDEQPGVTYLVSQIVAHDSPERRDLYYPAHMLRDEQGRITGCAALGQAWCE